MADDEAELSNVTNDLDLDAVVYLDETWHQEGFEEGKEAGRQRGHKEGRAVGKAKGFEIGCEIGYYKACCQTWLAVLSREKEEKKEEEEEDAEETEGEARKEHGEMGLVMDTTTEERVIRTMEGIVKLVNDFPRHNSPDIDMAEQVQRLRAKFRAAASILGVSVAFALHKSSRRGTAGGIATVAEGLSF